MKKLEEILRDKPIKNKLSFVFRIMDILYVVLALVAVARNFCIFLTKDRALLT